MKSFLREKLKVYNSLKVCFREIAVPQEEAHEHEIINHSFLIVAEWDVKKFELKKN